MKLALLAVLGVAAFAQDRDFLTADEVDQIRLTAEDPAARLKLYSLFARQRVDMIQSMLAKDKPGRSGLIHQTLDDYTKIIETIDVVVDDALKRGKDLTEGIGAVADAEKEMLEALRKIEESKPKDMARYQFVLTNAIEATTDSLELAQEDLAARKTAVVAKDAEQRKEREALMTPQDAKERRDLAAKKEEDEAKQKRKAPTLRRKGEVVKKQ